MEHDKLDAPWDAKTALRRSRRVAPPEEKLRELLHAQRIYLEIIRARRPLKALERSWDLLSYVRDSVLIGATVTPAEPAGSSSGLSGVSKTYWIQRIDSPDASVAASPSEADSEWRFARAAL